MSSTPPISTLLQRRPVQIGGREVFELIYCERHGRGNEASRIWGVTSEIVVDQYAAALQTSYPLLCGAEFNWQQLKLAEDASCVGKIEDLGSWMMGAATTDGISQTYLMLTSRCHEPSPVAAAKRRNDVVLHELVHLLQFQTDTWQHWPKQGRWGNADPNWWLHEAVALAIEAELAADYVGWYQWLWEWATSPQLSIESDKNGALAAPFLQYLIRRLGRPFASAIYRLTPDEVPSMRATDLLARAIADAAVHCSVPLRQVDMGSVFLDYCTDAGLGGTADCLLDPAIESIVGKRIRTEYFEGLPINWSSRDAAIDHLGCRYFEFQLTRGQKPLAFQIVPDDTESPPPLMASLTLVHDSSDRGRTCFFQPELSGNGIVCRVSPTPDETRAVLTIANVAFGSGWALHDGATFQISAEVA